jgi:hypothetical protein
LALPCTMLMVLMVPMLTSATRPKKTTTPIRIVTASKPNSNLHLSFFSVSKSGAQGRREGDLFFRAPYSLGAEKLILDKHTPLGAEDRYQVTLGCISPF